ncbi:hypothetical protein D9M69_386700 [compost metagenome]
MKEGVDKKDEQDEQDRHAHDEVPEAVGPLLEGGRRCRDQQGVGNFTKRRILPGAAHQHPGRAADHRCPQQHGVAGREDLCLFRQFTGGLFHRIWLAGKEGLVDEEVLCLQHPAVAGNQVAGGKERHIAGHQLRKRYLKGLAVPQHLPPYCHRLAQSIRRLTSPIFLNEIEGHADDDNGTDNEEADGVAGESGKGAGSEENDDQGIAKFGQKLEDQRSFPLPMDQVWAELCQARSRHSAAQSVRACGHLFQERRDRELPEC